MIALVIAGLIITAISGFALIQSETHPETVKIIDYPAKIITMDMIPSDSETSIVAEKDLK